MLPCYADIVGGAAVFLHCAEELKSQQVFRPVQNPAFQQEAHFSYVSSPSSSNLDPKPNLSRTVSGTACSKDSTSLDFIIVALCSQVDINHYKVELYSN
ncbi:hypothetical protein AAFF_G00423470 [Aldrovandia affinis]|uniref:Uncharacterized protein n=1 Tax=Aldrovandia affinis TaxID=143900 RepID=A0AAD7T6W2_9TELE|nr:hypothetical protein AAFF_G00423470 [Aldrovandia affinis]